jgi:hypothetical protein
MNTKTAVAIVPTDNRNVVEVDRTIHDPANLTDVVAGLMGALKGSLEDKDDVTIELSSHADATRTSTHLKLRGYRRAPR